MRRVLVLAISASVAAVSALAQGGGPPPMGGMGGPMGLGAGPGGGPGGGPGFHNHHGKLVTGLPYSATVTNTVVQQLAGGNSIQRTSSGQVARDSAGRTYEQQTISGGPFAQNGPATITFISDPTAGYMYVLNANTKTAMRHKLPASQSGTPDTNRPPRPPKDSSNVVEADLPADNSSGVTAQGKSVTRTIPAGAIGNTQPLVSTNETWYSSDLQIVVKAVRTDPRFGQSTYALTNVVAKEPDPALFQVPAGYTVTDAPQHGFRGGGPPPPPGQ